MTADGVRLAGVALDRVSAGDHPADLAIVVAHGLTNHVGKPVVRRVLDRLARTAPVVAFDLRGHGRSGGRSSVGDTEVLDIAAAVAVARARGHRRVATLGFSMGASVVLRHAALPDAGVAAVASVSSPARWWARETDAMRTVHWLLEQPHGRLVGRLVGVRVGPAWVHPPESPVEVVHRIAPTPLLLVHGDRDHYFPSEHAGALHRAAGRGSELWLLPGVGHAESAMAPDVVDRIALWLARLADPPVRAPGPNRSEKDEPTA